MHDPRQLNRSLAYLGFADLDSFFASPDWQSLQSKVLRAHEYTCLHCGGPAEIVRPLDETIATLKGKHPDALEPICEACVDRLPMLIFS